MTKRRKLVLIDGHAIIHRAFHAMPTLTSPKGELVNGVYGFSLILLNVLKDIKPTHLVVALDIGGETIRHKQYSDYKAHRVQAPQELHDQVPRIKEVLGAFNIPVFLKKGYEADDIIGTLAKQAEKIDNLETIIVTGDLDTLQLVSPHTRVYTMKRGLTDTVIYNENQVRERYGFNPSQVVDFKGLRGDPSDNIPGVKGIGEKTATELLKKYKDINGVYRALKNGSSDIRERYKQILIEHEKEAFLSKKLATILTNLPIRIDLKKAELKNYKRTDVLKIFQELGFKSLLSRLPETKSETESSQKTIFEQNKLEEKTNHGKYYLVKNKKQFKDLLKLINNCKHFVFDVETDTLHGRLIGISFAFREKEAYYLPLMGSNNNYYLEALRPYFENKKIKKTGHNLKYDYLILAKEGIRVQGLEFDTMLAAYILNPGKRNYDLDSLAFVELGLEKISIEDLIGKGKEQKRLSEVQLKKVSDYSCEDSDITYRLYNLYLPQLKGKVAQVFYSIEMPLISVLAQMEKHGIKLDALFLKKMSNKIKKETDLITQKIYRLSRIKFNINSPSQLREILFERLKIDTVDVGKTKTGLSTAAAELEKIRERHKIIDLIVKYREITKLKNTYLDALPKLIDKKGRIHTSFNQTITTTGRLSSSKPNLQNIPIRTKLGNKIRQAFIADKGYKLIAFDYSQIELRIVAHLARDSKMISAFKKGEDIHAATASWLFHKSIKKISDFERREAKTVNFGVLYGMSSYGLSQGMKVDRDYAAEFIDNYFDTFKGIKKYLDNTKKIAKETGYVETMFGRRRYIPEINSNVYEIAAAAERMAINMPVQGTAADIIKLAMIKIQKEVLDKDNNIKLLLQVHDELVFEVKRELTEKYATKIKNIMEEVYKLTVPIKVDISIGTNWGTLNKVK